MSLTAAEVAEIMRLVEQSTFDELTLEMDGVKLALRRGAAVGGGVASSGDGNFGSGGRGVGSAGGGAIPGSAGYPAVTPSATRAVAANSTTSGTAAISASAANGTPTVAPPNANEHDVLSPLLGTFYRSPKPGAPPFVEVGATVEPDTVIAIIEVMKLMNTVRAGVKGTVTHIFSADGSLVEFEQPLIRVSKAG